MKPALADRIGSAGLGVVVAFGVLYPLHQLAIDETFGVSFPAWHLWIVLVAAALGALGLVRWIASVGVAALLVLLAVELLPGPSRLARRYIREDPLPATPVDAIVVLSAAINADGVINPIGLERLREGIRLHRTGQSNRLILSSVQWDNREGVRSDADQRAIVADAGVTPELHIVTGVSSTRTEAVRIAELAMPRSWRTIILVTSPTHTRRACATFEAVGFTVTCRPSPDRSIAWSHLGAPVDRGRAFGLWLYEVLGWWKYRAAGWVHPPGEAATPAVRASAPAGRIDATPGRRAPALGGPVRDAERGLSPPAARR